MGRSGKTRDQYRESRKTEDGQLTLPRKHFYRQRAHANPFSDHSITYPDSPTSMDWSALYPETNLNSKQVEVVDIGCGFGGLLFALSPKLPDTLILGMEIRHSVADFVQEKVTALRAQHASEKLYGNVSCIRANSMKNMPNYFFKGQLSKLFFCFPDPHFKQRKHKARIVSSTLTSEYAYVLRPGGIIYTITDVEALHLWMKGHFESCPLFEAITEEELKEDECVEIMKTETEEGKKVGRNQGIKYIACFKRVHDPPWP